AQSHHQAHYDRVAAGPRASFGASAFVIASYKIARHTATHPRATSRPPDRRVQGPSYPPTPSLSTVPVPRDQSSSSLRSILARSKYDIGGVSGLGGCCARPCGLRRRRNESEIISLWAFSLTISHGFGFPLTTGPCSRSIFAASSSSTMART